MKITLDSGLCQGHMRCTILAPDHFDADDEGFGVVTVPVVDSPIDVDLAHAAAEGCPERAIRVES